MKTTRLTGCICLMLSSLVQAELPVTQQRQQLFEEIEQQNEQLEQLLDENAWQQSSTQALRLADQVAQLNDLFPVASQGDGRARQGIWDEWPEFSHRLQRFEQHYRDVSAALTEQDYAAAEQAFDDADSSCRSCHMSYRSIW